MASSATSTTTRDYSKQNNMKDFDLAAAKRGATVCTRDERPVRILAFDFKDEPYCIVAAYFEEESEIVEFYDKYGFMCVNIDGSHPVLSSDDLMMADDDYLEKLERGEYDHIGEVTEKVDWDYWRRMYAGMAMKAMMDDYNHHCDDMTEDTVFASFVARSSVFVADALIAALKKTE